MSGREWPLGRLAKRLGAELHGDPERVVRAIAPLGVAGEGDLSFLANRRYLRDLRTTRASAVIVGPGDAEASPTAVLVLPNPYLGYARAASGRFPVRIEGGSVAGIDFVLYPGITLRGVVTGRPSGALAGISVRASQERLLGGMTTPDLEGRFRIDELGPGTWTVRAEERD